MILNNLAHFYPLTISLLNIISELYNYVTARSNTFKMSTVSAQYSDRTIRNRRFFKL